jgi:hypothetical protein
VIIIINKILCLLFVIGGIASIRGGAMNLDGFMNNDRAKFIGMFLGRTGARIFYVVIGTALTIFGTLGLLGIINLDK